jgi:class 3 adenylate cyclase
MRMTPSVPFTLPAPEPVQVRVGTATGMVVVGDLVGSGKGQERDIVGETPNLAARLQAIAEPNTVVIAEPTRRLLGSLFELRDLGPKELKGITGPVKAFAVHWSLFSFRFPQCVGFCVSGRIPRAYAG